MSFFSQKYHEAVLQFLFALDMGGEGEGEALIALLMQELALTRQVATRAYEKASRVFSDREVGDREVATRARAYEWERIQRVERNVLRLALYEMREEQNDAYSYEQIIGEALRLTRKFSTPEATAFVNALLDEKSTDESASTLSPSYTTTPE